MWIEVNPITSKQGLIRVIFILPLQFAAVLMLGYRRIGDLETLL
jgi:hypothetical protein